MVEPIDQELELTILMPCLNEAETLETCIRKAMRFLELNSISGEVLIADNGSTDGSQDIALKCGARLVPVAEKGYGAALIGGCNAAKSKYIIMGDADDSYDFLNLMPFVAKLRNGYDLVMGNRFAGGIAKGAMPPLHRYLGNPVLSTIGRLFYPSDIKDFHCGLRGYRTESIRALNLRTTGMEYASEMVVQSTLHQLRMTEVPTTLVPDGRSRAPHLRSWHDGWRHLKFLLIHSPNWLFLYPGLVLFALGLILTIILTVGPIRLGSLTFDINTMMFTAIMTITGMQIMLFSILTKIYAANTGYIPQKDIRIFKKVLSPNKGIFIGSVLFLIGLIASISALMIWSDTSFENLNPEIMLRITIPALICICMGVQLIFNSFFIEILNIKHK